MIRHYVAALLFPNLFTHISPFCLWADYGLELWATWDLDQGLEDLTHMSQSPYEQGGIETLEPTPPSAIKLVRYLGYFIQPKLPFQSYQEFLLLFKSVFRFQKLGRETATKIPDDIATLHSCRSRPETLFRRHENSPTRRFCRHDNSPTLWFID